MDFSIVIPTYNRVGLLIELLKSLSFLNTPKNFKWEIIVVDNNSSDNTRDVVSGFCCQNRLPVLYCHEPLQGSSHARNTGARRAKGEIVAFLDDDEIVDPQWLIAILKGFEESSCSGVGGKIIARWVTPVPKWYTLNGPYRIVGPTAEHNIGEIRREYTINDCLPATGNFAVKKNLFSVYGYFSTAMGPVGSDYFIGEDTEFCLRLMNQREKLFYLPKAIVYNTVHKERLTKSYCRKYHFRFGRSLAQLSKGATWIKRWGPVPRHLYRELVEAFIRWIFSSISSGGKAVFFYELQLDRVAGQIYEEFFKKTNSRHVISESGKAK
jgi:glycosyltransferase involved in cell wall biosynthesis